LVKKQANKPTKLKKKQKQKQKQQHYNITTLHSMQVMQVLVNMDNIDFLKLQYTVGLNVYIFLQEESLYLV